MFEMKKKKIIREFPWEKHNKNFVKCEQPNCNNKGEYSAPKSVHSDEKYNFCLEHVKIYNKRWDFFAGQSQNQIYDFLKNDMYFGKPTKPMSDKISSKINFDFCFITKDSINENTVPNNEDHSIIKNNKLRKAMKLFGLNLPFSAAQLKKKYNNLVKKNHPDLHGGDSKKEDLLKKINICYKLLKKIAR